MTNTPQTPNTDPADGVQADAVQADDVPTPHAPALDLAAHAPTIVGPAPDFSADLRDLIGHALHAADGERTMPYHHYAAHYAPAVESVLNAVLTRFLAYEHRLRDLGDTLTTALLDLARASRRAADARAHATHWRDLGDDRARELCAVLDVEDPTGYLPPWPALIARVTELSAASVSWGVERDELTAELAAARGWQPITTVPRDGRVVRLCWDDTAGAGLYATWDTTPGRWLTTNGAVELNDPRWWQPVTPHPGPPADKGGSSKRCGTGAHDDCPGFYGVAHTPDAPDFLCVCTCHHARLRRSATAAAEPKDINQ